MLTVSPALGIIREKNVLLFQLLVSRETKSKPTGIREWRRKKSMFNHGVTILIEVGSIFELKKLLTKH
jgi:hypothetical protein